MFTDQQTPDTRPGHYYVTAIDGGRWFKMAGPYNQHADALADVDRARDIASNVDGRAHFMSWGTCRTENSTDIGTLNKHNLI
jgi:hypothetical protein